MQVVTSLTSTVSFPSAMCSTRTNGATNGGSPLTVFARKNWTSAEVHASGSINLPSGNAPSNWINISMFTAKKQQIDNGGALFHIFFRDPYAEQTRANST